MKEKGNEDKYDESWKEEELEREKRDTEVLATQVEDVRRFLRDYKMEL